MIEEIGVITAVDHDHIWVDTQIKTTCGGCQLNDDCGTGAVAKAFSPKTEQLVLRCQQSAKVGQKVKLGIPENHLLAASGLVYLLPLLVMIATALLSQWALPLIDLNSELWIIAATLTATTVCFSIIKNYLKQAGQHKYQPKLLAVIPFELETINLIQMDSDD